MKFQRKMKTFELAVVIDGRCEHLTNITLVGNQLGRLSCRDIFLQVRLFVELRFCRWPVQLSERNYKKNGGRL